MHNEAIRLDLKDGKVMKKIPSKSVVGYVDGLAQLGFEVKKVDVLPDVGETKYLYLVPKEGSGEDVCDEYVWAVQEDGTYGWELVGSTAVQVILYDGLGENTDGAMTQAATTSALGGKQDTIIPGTNVSIASDGVTISATDTTYSAFVGATPSVAGDAGLVPAPGVNDSAKYLKGDGSWADAGPEVVQTTGQSTTQVMSQKAVSDALGDIETILHEINNGTES